MNKCWVWMNWQKANYSRNLHHYIEENRKFLLELDSVSVKMPSTILSYITPGKLAGDQKLCQIMELLTFNEEIIEKPDQIVSCLQEYANHCQTLHSCMRTLAPSSELVSSTSNGLYQIIYYFSNGKPNPMCLPHRKEECFAKNSHLRRQRLDKKRKPLIPILLLNSLQHKLFIPMQITDYLWDNLSWTVGQLTTFPTWKRCSPPYPKILHSQSPQEIYPVT
ncbi:hypothetical protein O181_020879 [Austropuccinia psidii MF-1]|uniref:Uncharacterized protein n=1 Tax=Austropuccinia psidii MF-1 TaxID=1389203 RepID=A0A9Q3GW45_9BASI|nr:hypothetical protein [Austropuccinia psidii MF-1]